MGLVAGTAVCIFYVGRKTYKFDKQLCIELIDIVFDSCWAMFVEVYSCAI